MDKLRTWLNTALLLICAMGIINVSIKATELRQSAVNIEARLLLMSQR